jgi:hypothetical protein
VAAVHTLDVINNALPTDEESSTMSVAATPYQPVAPCHTVTPIGEKGEGQAEIGR